MSNFYFTYGTNSDFPFYGGWTRIIASSEREAREAFTMVHPNRDGCLNCAMVYTQEEWETTQMYQKGTNCGYGEYEVVNAADVLHNKKEIPEDRKLVYVTATPYATVTGTIEVPKACKTEGQVRKWIDEHFRDINFGQPELDYAGASLFIDDPDASVSRTEEI